MLSGISNVIKVSEYIFIHNHTHSWPIVRSKEEWERGVGGGEGRDGSTYNYLFCRIEV